MPAVATAGGLPTRLGKYEIMMPLAAGGMARIYIGRTTGIGSFERHVVLKLITPERANDHTAVQMFLDEARLAACLNHQNVAQVFEVGEDSNIHYLAMEYVHGQDLRALLAKAGSQGTRVPLELALTVVAGAAAGLNHAHERRGSDGVPLGIVHRDVSPSNIMIGYDGSVKLLDFGIAKATARSIETQSGIIKGKFAYMAPEQCRGRDVDRRSDVFSLGIILYEITTQHRCFRADSDFDTMHRIVTGDVVRPTRLIQGYPPALEAIVMKALAVDAVQRYQSAGALLEAIEAFAVSGRMSLSTMSLGRFMRDMFGDQSEPWLNNSGRNSQPLTPKESTISNTNGTGSDAMQRPLPPPAAPIEQAPTHLQSARTLLDLPRGESQHDDPQAAEWNAKSYPTMQPAYASTATLPPESMVGRSSSPMLPGLPPHGSSGHLPLPLPAPAHQTPPVPTPVTPSGGYAAQPNPMHQRPPAGQFPPTPGSGSHSGPAHAAPVVSTRHGYASAPGTTRGDVSYPRYESTGGMGDADMQLKPNRRPLFIGLGIAAIGFIVLLMMTLGGGKEDESKDEPTVNMNTGSEQGSSGTTGTTGTATSPQVAPPQKTVPDKTVPEKTVPDKTPANQDTKTGAGSATVEAPPVVQETSVKIHITSEPEGAEVLLNGKPIGATPLTTKVQRTSTPGSLKLRKSKYLEIVKDVDLTQDYEASLTLKKDGETKRSPEPVVKKSPEPNVKKSPEPVVKKTPVTNNTNNTTNNTTNSGTATPPPPAKSCQPPAQYDPTDPRPPCKS